MSKGLLSPKVDFIFKKIFGSEKHPRILISFLNAIMKLEYPICQVEIKETDINKSFLEDKFSRLDIKATTDKGERINIEIQLKNEHNMIQRSLYYWSKLYEEQMSEGDAYEKLERTVCINILDFKYLKNDKYHTAYRLKEIETHEELTDLQEIHFIEIPKLKDVPEQVEDMLAGWVEFLKDPESEKVRQLELSHEEMREAKDELCRISRDSKERELYEMRENSLRDKISALYTAELKGIEKGMKQGIQKGIQQGIQQEKLALAKGLLDVLDDATIAFKIGITEDEVNKLRKSTHVD